MKRKKCQMNKLEGSKKRRVLLPLKSPTQLMMSLFFIGSANEASGRGGGVRLKKSVIKMNIQFILIPVCEHK